MLRGLILPAALLLAATAAAQAGWPTDDPQVGSGLAVIIGIDLEKAADLAGRGYYVHLLDTDAAKVADARARLSKQGIYGARIAVDLCDAPRLPHADNTVNLLIAADGKLARDEAMRVLTAGGQATLDGQTIRKPRPEAMGDWTHPRCGPDGNPVSTDSMVQPSRQIRWQAGPLWGHHCGPVGGVSAGGRLFYVLREQPLGAHAMPRYRLIARDGGNGMLLWSRSVPGRANAKWPFYTPQFSPAALVASDDRVYCSPASGEPLAALDSRTGKLLKTYNDAPAPESVLLSDGVLILARRSDLNAVDAETGKVLWSQGGTLTRNSAVWSASAVVAVNGRTVFRRQAKGKPVELAAVATRTGEQLWTSDAANSPVGGWHDYEILLAYDNVVLLHGMKGVCGVSADKGQLLWHRPGGAGSAFGTAGRIWLRGATSVPGAHYGWTAVDPATGQADREVAVPKKLPEGIAGKRILDGQCNFEVATSNYIVTTTRMSLVDVRSGDFHNTMITRGPCKFLLAIPANGLLYSFPKDCICYPCLRGVVAYGPGSDPPAGDAHPLVDGPAEAPADAPRPAADDWPTYRGNPQRTSATAAAGPKTLDALWSADLGGRLTAPVVSGGRVYVADTDRHTLFAVNAASGEVAWSYIAGGRIDSPPTVTGGLCIVGCRDGWVYALRADDGREVWRLRAAPAEQRIPAFEQLESPWPAFGTVLDDGERVFASAGHHANAAGGISVVAMEPRTGKLLWQSKPDYECINNVLTLTPSGNVYLAAYKIAYDAKSGKPVRDAASLDASKAGFLNDEALRVLPVTDGTRTVEAFAGKTPQNKWQVNATPGEGYTVTLSRPGAGGKAQPAWSRDKLPVRINSVVLTPAAVFVAGGNDAPWNAEAANPWAVIDGEVGGAVEALSVDDGKQAARAALDAPTVRDGLAIAGGMLYAATRTGRLYCLGQK